MKRCVLVVLFSWLVSPAGKQHQNHKIAMGIRLRKVDQLPEWPISAAWDFGVCFVLLPPLVSGGFEGCENGDMGQPASAHEPIGRKKYIFQCFRSGQSP